MINKSNNILGVAEEGLPFVLDTIKQEARAVSPSYTLEKNEKFISSEEYTKSQGKTFGKLIKDGHEKIEATQKIDKFKIRLDGYIENVKTFWKQQPFFYDKQGLFWFWSLENSKYEIVDEVDVMKTLDDLLGLEGQTVSGGVKSNYIEAFKRIGRDRQPKEAPLKWIQFKNKAFSINSGKIYKVEPNYFFTNPIPWEIGENGETPIMDELFEQWAGKDNINLLYEILAYCCYRSYPIQVLFCLIGAGRNGKSCFIRLLQSFIGSANVSSTELDLITGYGSSRFETFKLYRKLVCVMGETNFSNLSKSSIIKKLTGGDLIGFEMKNKNPFDGYNYSKLLIASNSLPTTEDTSEGFYRRWIIIDFPNQFPEGKDILKTIPEEEYRNLAYKITKLLPVIINRGNFTNQGTIEHRTKKYEMASNPIKFFFNDFCELKEDTFVSYGELYTAYVLYLKKHKKRRIKMKEFRRALEDEGFFPEKTNKPDGHNEDGYTKFKSAMYVEGIKLKENWKNYENYDNYEVLSTQSPIRENQVENTSYSSYSSYSYEIIHAKCSKCGLAKCKGYDEKNEGKPLCEFCIGNEGDKK